MAMKESTMVLLVMAGILVFAIFYMGGGVKTTTTTPTTPTTPTTCTSDTQVAVTFQAFNKYDPSSAQTANFSVRKVGTQAWTTVASGSSQNYAPGDTLEILADNNFNAGYAVYTPTFTVPCKTAATFEVSIPSKYTSGIAATYWNSQGTAATAQPIAAGDVKNVKFQFTGTYKKEYGSAAIGATSNIINCQANNTQIKKMTIAGLTATAKPSIIASAAGIDDYTYSFPVIASNSDTSIYTVTIEASATVNPTDNIVCTVYDSNYFINSLTNGVESGPQDDNKVNLGVQEGSVAATATLLLS